MSMSQWFRHTALVAVILALTAGLIYLISALVTPLITENSTTTTTTTTGAYAGKKILFIDSYHEGYDWSDGITRGVVSKLEGTGVDLKIVRMDTKRNPDDDFRRRAGEKAMEEVELFKPDVVIASDDNAFKYVIMPFYRDAAMPVVFCGLNWDASLYGAPYANTTGMVEVSLTSRLIQHLSKFANGKRVGYLSADTETERKNAEYYDKLSGIAFAETRFVTTMEEWEEAFDFMQDNVDILIFENNAGITDWNEARAVAFALKRTKIPAGTTNSWVMPVALMGLTKVPEEQGEWSAARALDILGGKKPSEIPVTTNQRGDVFLNFTIAEKLGITFAPGLIKAARIIR